MDAAKLRPLGIGEVLDAGIKVYRARFGTLVKATAIVLSPVYALFALVELSTTPDDGELGSSEFDSDFGAEFGAENTVTADEVGVFVVGALLVGGLMFIATQFATAVAVKIVAAAYLGEETTWRQSLRAVWSRKWTIVWLSVLYGLFLLAGVAFVVLTGAAGLGIALPILAGIAVVLLGIYLYGAWMVTVPVLMTEGLSAWKALGRSRRLVTKRWWPVVVVVVLSTLLSQVLVGVASMVVIGLVAVGANDFAGTVASVVVNAVGSAVTTPFIASIVVVAYFDLRVRKEGFDLELLARTVGVEPEGSPWAPSSLAPPPPPPPPTAADDPSHPPFWPPPPGWRPPDA